MISMYCKYSKKAFLLFILSFTIFLLAIVLSGCIEETKKEINASEQENITNYGQISPQKTHVALSIETDKKEYSSNENAKINVIAISSASIPNVKVKIWGIETYTRNYIQDERIVNLKIGDNRIEFNTKMPYCTSGCGGVYPGAYLIHATLEAQGNEIAQAKTEILLLNK
ncbi:MAG: hypothetical protein N3F05_01475 [Candidatus Diapherotrites archaeon]|nr:hypothetical protein [Candidatus Diapherotrites archaeon]